MIVSYKVQTIHFPPLTLISTTTNDVTSNSSMVLYSTQERNGPRRIDKVKTQNETRETDTERDTKGTRSKNERTHGYCARRAKQRSTELCLGSVYIDVPQLYTSAVRGTTPTPPTLSPQ